MIFEDFWPVLQFAMPGSGDTCNFFQNSSSAGLDNLKDKIHSDTATKVEYTVTETT